MPARAAAPDLQPVMPAPAKATPSCDILGRFAAVTGARKSASHGARFLRGMQKMAEHKHGSMDIKVQEKTFEGFINFTIRAVMVILVLVVLMAMWNA